MKHFCSYPLINIHICSCCPSPPLCVSLNPSCSLRSCDVSRWLFASFLMAISSYSRERKKLFFFFTATLFAFAKSSSKIMYAFQIKQWTHQANANAKNVSFTQWYGHSSHLNMQLWASTKQYPDTNRAQALTHTYIHPDTQQNEPLSKLNGVRLVFWARPPPLLITGQQTASQGLEQCVVTEQRAFSPQSHLD